MVKQNCVVSNVANVVQELCMQPTSSCTISSASPPVLQQTAAESRPIKNRLAS